MAQQTQKLTEKPSAKPSAKAPAKKPASTTNKPVNKQASKPANKPTNKSSAKSNNNAYKKGKLSKNARFSPRRINWIPIIILVCLVVTFILAVIVGNALSKKADNSQNTTPPTNDSSNLVPPSADKVAPHKELHAYFADMTNADPEKSLSELTSGARDRGNAIFINFKNHENKLIYSSEKANELGFQCKENLTLARLNNHFEYYNDFAVGFFASDFSSKLSTEEALKLQTNEILLLKEATDTAFDQLIVEFAGTITKSNAIYYQIYLLNLKLACPTTPIGIKLSVSFLNNSDNSGTIAELLSIADFFVLDFDTQSTNDIKTKLTPLIYFAERYDCVVMLSEADETTLAEKISALSDKGIENYIVK